MDREELKQMIDDNRDIHISLLKDSLQDLRIQNKFFRKMIYLLSFVIVVLIACMSALNVYNQNKLEKMANDNADRFVRFLYETEISSEVYIDTDNESYNQGNISLQK